MLRDIEKVAIETDKTSILGRTDFALGPEAGKLREQLNFATNYFRFVRGTLTDPFYQVIALFLGNR